SEPGDNLNVRAIIGMLASIGGNVMDMVLKFDGKVRAKNWVNKVDLGKSFVRLDNPILKKLGGGLRVKRVEIFDNWSNMTNQQQVESKYGHEYTYTTTSSINGTETLI